MLVNNYDYSEFLLFNITTDTGTLTNASGSTITLNMGTAIGRIAATGLLVQQVSTATDGSQVPIGLLATGYVIPTGTSQVMTYVKAGEVNAQQVQLSAGDTLLTSITDNSTHLGTIGDILAGKGILLKGGTNINYLDTQ